jgi:hypothetical protein
MQIKLPPQFGFYWVKVTSLKYNIIDEANSIYEYIFNFVFLFIIFYIFFINFLYYYMEIPVPTEHGQKYFSIKLFYFNIITGIVFALNILYVIINCKSLFKITQLLNNCSELEKITFITLRSYYRLWVCINIIICFIIFFLYAWALFKFNYIDYNNFYSMFIKYYKIY